MLQWLKDHFIPAETNEYQPHFLRIKIVAGLIGIIFAVELLYVASSFIVLPTNDYFAAIFASVLVDQTNQERGTASLGSLTVNETLVKAAQMKADDMATRGYFSHINPDGKNSWYWFRAVGYNYAAAGENLAVNFTDSKDVTEAWMHSPSHRSNIMGENYTEIGIATAHGIYKGKDAIFVVQMFGRPSLIARGENTGTTTINKVGGTIETINPPEAKPKENEAPVVIQTKVAPKVVALPVAQSIAAVGVPTTTTVAGAETTKLPIEEASLQEDKIAAQPIDATKNTVVTNSKPTLLEKIIASPHQATNTLYMILAALMVLALGLAIFVKVRIQYPHIIGNGILVLAALLAIFLLNSALNISGGII